MLSICEVCSCVQSSGCQLWPVPPTTPSWLYFHVRAYRLLKALAKLLDNGDRLIGLASFDCQPPPLPKSVCKIVEALVLGVIFPESSAGQRLVHTCLVEKA